MLRPYIQAVHKGLQFQRALYFHSTAYLEEEIHVQQVYSLFFFTLNSECMYPIIFLLKSYVYIVGDCTLAVRIGSDGSE